MSDLIQWQLGIGAVMSAVEGGRLLYRVTTLAEDSPAAQSPQPPTSTQTAGAASTPRPLRPPE
jgi:hypothetical protein